MCNYFQLRLYIELSKIDIKRDSLYGLKIERTVIEELKNDLVENEKNKQSKLCKKVSKISSWTNMWDIKQKVNIFMIQTTLILIIIVHNLFILLIN